MMNKEGGNIFRPTIVKSIISLSNMIREMLNKNLELSRITKTACLLIDSGLSLRNIPESLIERCVNEQREDGGWVAVPDTIWNTYLLQQYNKHEHERIISSAKQYILNQKSVTGLWGRSKRDMSRIPVTGTLFSIFPDLATYDGLVLLEDLWFSEIDSISYKAGYTLMAFGHNSYVPKREDIIKRTVEWLVQNQRSDGGFAPWLNHPVSSDIFCTSIAILGLIKYMNLVNKDIFIKALEWIETTQLKEGIWRFHEIEDGASWGVRALVELNSILGNK